MRDSEVVNRSTLCFVTALALVGTSSATTIAHAQTAPRESREVGRLLREGAAAFDAHDDATALALFQQAYRVSEEPTILVNIGRVFARMRRHDDAIATYERYLSRVPDAPERGAIEGLIREQREARDAPTNAARDAAVREERARQERARQEREERERRERERQSRGVGAGPWVLLGVGGAIAVGSLIPWFAIREPNRQTLESRIGTDCTIVAGVVECFDDGSPSGAYNTANADQIAFGAMLGVGLAAAATGGIWAAVAAARTEPRVAISIDPRGSIVLAGTFGGAR
jgi:tetratricopeptide (TPR) repeat protein